ncbi:hypothetical protein [Pseudoalteromonas rubra]|uniref:hypothetical protein n=1 Tax=Pseudoalteromonas rubra TaxID=43658 RepID=UPI002DB600BA|nr:hypothetical protein [Pseudoalteromonas rubra]MEC4088875.1 hypothetical protein [Pseudoalteromonas rubra]
MMKNRGSYPHPVIDTSDDISSDFKPNNVRISFNSQDIEIEYEISTDDQDLLSLIDNGDAFHSFRWRCSATISSGELKPRHERTKKGFKLITSLDQQMVKGPVDADIRVIVSRRVLKHCWSKQHPDYHNATFDLLPGDVLADGGKIRFDAEKMYDPVNPPLGSCFKLIKSTAISQRGIELDFRGSETVTIKISSKMYDSFQLFSHRPDLQIALVILPALMETLSYIKQNKATKDEPMDNVVWYTELTRLVEEVHRCSWEDDSSLSIAQKILENPIDRAVCEGLISEDEN